MTPRQREVLESRGYDAEDLAGMPRRVVSRHIGGELGPQDAHRSRGLRPPADQAASSVPGADADRFAGRPPILERQERERREREERRGRRRRR